MSTPPRHPAFQANKLAISSFNASSPLKRRKMSVTETYHLAHQARAKLSVEAAQPDHNLRLLVGHANLLDSLMLDLAAAERDQERWFNHAVSNVHKSAESRPAHIQWVDTIIESDLPEDDEIEVAVDSSDDSESEDEVEADDGELTTATPIAVRRVPAMAPAITIEAVEVDDSDDSDYEDDEEDYADLALVRTPSRQPPELSHDSDEESSEDESTPPSPPQPTFVLCGKQGKGVSTASFFDQPESTSSSQKSPSDLSPPLDHPYYLPNQDLSTMIPAY